MLLDAAVAPILFKVYSDHSRIYQFSINSVSHAVKPSQTSPMACLRGSAKRLMTLIGVIVVVLLLHEFTVSARWKEQGVTTERDLKDLLKLIKVKCRQARFSSEAKRECNEHTKEAAYRPIRQWMNMVQRAGTKPLPYWGGSIADMRLLENKGRLSEYLGRLKTGFLKDCPLGTEEITPLTISLDDSDLKNGKAAKAGAMMQFCEMVRKRQKWRWVLKPKGGAYGEVELLNFEHHRGLPNQVLLCLQTISKVYTSKHGIPWIKGEWLTAQHVILILTLTLRGCADLDPTPKGSCYKTFCKTH